MKKIVFLFLFISLLLTSLPQASAQTTGFDTTGFPQWAIDLRRWNIISFGLFPFAMFFTRTGYDIHRMSINGWDMNYAPWPLKPAGAPGYDNHEIRRNVLIAAGLSVTVAAVDLLIVSIRRRNERRRLEARPAGSVIIERTPISGNIDEPDDNDDTEIDDLTGDD